ncbi:unnamed protein product (macronuclear) [Paramecium tetraurelia]|uniref:Uncharacterized protein n=1 Tax=Paramecium tetraurelia TaxID=5888 RepID=A0C5L7_PARTE|nr:uncharacterized protein GSPATT00035213001 [Paramecium tetraurelia]CAK66084.1 unnamed protein product [Paramecium tetraurelia]|eukprot:XP_001433481.1 hypothetical protein (macronuclear) [Paramecium tetraurelia strain d4-2]
MKQKLAQQKKQNQKHGFTKEETADGLAFGYYQFQKKVGIWSIEYPDRIEYGEFDGEFKVGEWIIKNRFEGLQQEIKNTTNNLNNKQQNYDTEVDSTLSPQISFTNGITDTIRKPNIITKSEQIEYLRWHGNYGMNNKKIGYLMATWKRRSNVERKKQGQWREIIKNYSTLAEVVEVGQYLNDVKQGVWKYIYENKEMRRSLQY